MGKKIVPLICSPGGFRGERVTDLEKHIFCGGGGGGGLFGINNKKIILATIMQHAASGYCTNFAENVPNGIPEIHFPLENSVFGTHDF